MCSKYKHRIFQHCWITKLVNQSRSVLGGEGQQANGARDERGQKGNRKGTERGQIRGDVGFYLEVFRPRDLC